MNDKLIEKGDTVKFSYVGKIKDGSVFDTSDAPITSEVGTGKLIDGLDKGMLSMSEGEEKTIEINPEQGYGDEDPGLVSSIPRKAFQENNLEPELGMRLKTPKGKCYVSRVSEEDVEVNFNHPLAGKTLVFDVKVEEITKK
jgi:peptidylprolyl isomerase